MSKDTLVTIQMDFSNEVEATSAIAAYFRETYVDTNPPGRDGPPWVIESKYVSVMGLLFFLSGVEWERPDRVVVVITDEEFDPFVWRPANRPREFPLTCITHALKDFPGVSL